MIDETLRKMHGAQSLVVCEDTMVDPYDLMFLDLPRTSSLRLEALPNAVERL